MTKRDTWSLVGLVGLALACGPADEPTPTEPAAPGLYVSVTGGKVASNFPTKLRVFDLSDPDDLRSELVLDAEDGGWVQHLSDGRSPSGRYGLYLYAHDFGGQGFDPWLFGLHLMDFEGAPLGPTRYLGIPGTQASAGWTADERLMWLRAINDGETSLWTLALGDDAPQPLARIPIDVPAPAHVYDCRFAPGGAWMYFLAGYDRLFAVRFEDRQPVELQEILAPDDTTLSMPLWLDAYGRGLADANDGSDRRLVAFDVSIEARAQDVVVADVPGTTGTTLAWMAWETEDGQLWALQRIHEDDVRRLAWVALDWTEHGVVADTPIEVDALMYASGGLDRQFAGDGFYFHGPEKLDPAGEQLMYVRVGEATSEELWPSNFKLNYYATNRAQTLLLAHGDAGVLAFELGPDGPGPAQLVSVNGWSPWGLHDDRFVQAFGEGLGNSVRVVEFGAGPPTAWQLSAIAPRAAVPSPLDTRVFVLDDRQLWVDDLDAPGMRTQLVLPNTDPEIYDPASDELFGEYAVAEAVVHAPGIASYAPW